MKKMAVENFTSFYNFTGLIATSDGFDNVWLDLARLVKISKNFKNFPKFSSSSTDFSVLTVEVEKMLSDMRGKS